MHIFNLNNKPYLIISSEDILFRQNTLDEQMQRIPFSQIKKINIIHRYNPEKELYIWLSIQTTTKTAPYLIQVSLLDEELEEVFSVLKDELKSKVKLSLPKSAKLSKLRTYNKDYKRLCVLTVLLLLSLLLYHKLVLPPLESVQKGAIKLVEKKQKGFCSTNLKVAYPMQNKQDTLVQSYCGLFGFWKLQDSKKVPLKYLRTEFESYSARDWILAAGKLIKEKKYNKAIAGLEKACYLEPNNGNAQVLLSNVYKLQGNHEKALSLAKETVKKFPNLAYAHENIAYLYKDEDNISAASKHFKASINLNPKASLYLSLAQIQNSQNLKKEALSNYEKALVLDPNNSNILTMIGLMYWDSKQFELAKTALQKAYHLEPKNAAYFLNYYEVSLVTTALVTPQEKEQFLQENKDDEDSIMVYEMLKIIEASIEGKESFEAKERWKEKYHDTKLDWSFSQMRSWLNDSNLEIEHIQNIQSTLGFFIGHQQVYNLNHPQEFH